MRIFSTALILLLLVSATASAEPERQSIQIPYLDLSNSVIDFTWSKGTPVFVRNREVHHPDLLYTSDDLLVPVTVLKKVLTAEELSRVYIAEQGLAIDGAIVVYQGLKPGYVPLLRVLWALDFDISYDEGLELVDAVPPGAGQGSPTAVATTSGSPPKGRVERLLDRRLQNRKAAVYKAERRWDESWGNRRELKYDAGETIDQAIFTWGQKPANYYDALVPMPIPAHLP